MREGEDFLNYLAYGPVVVRPRRVDAEKEAFQEDFLVGRCGDQPLHEVRPGAEIWIHHRPGALQNKASDKLRVAQRQLLGDDASGGETRHVGGVYAQRPEHASRVVRHRLNRQRRTTRVGGPARAAVVKGREAIGIGEPVQLELPRFDGIPEPADQQHIRALADLLRPDSQVPALYVLSHAVAFRFAMLSCGTWNVGTKPVTEVKSVPPDPCTQRSFLSPVTTTSNRSRSPAKYRREA